MGDGAEGAGFLGPADWPAANPLLPSRGDGIRAAHLLIRPSEAVERRGPSRPPASPCAQCLTVREHRVSEMRPGEDSLFASRLHLMRALLPALLALAILAAWRERIRLGATLWAGGDER